MNDAIFHPWRPFWACQVSTQPKCLNNHFKCEVEENGQCVLEWCCSDLGLRKEIIKGGAYFVNPLISILAKVIESSLFIFP